MFILVFIAVLNATVSLYYYLLVVKAMFINKAEAPLPTLTSTIYEKLALTICMAGVLMIGFISSIYQYISTIL
jgi:NADH-quinone oxidoreductase subunit N